jgi:uncharacterized protein YodC (DUF2158 family)
MPTYYTGDILQLKTGGIAMTAGELDPKRGRRCAWSTKDDVKERFFPDEMLRPYEEDRVAAIRVTLVDSYEPKFKAALESIAGGATNAQDVATAVLKEAAEDPGRSMPPRK